MAACPGTTQLETTFRNALRDARSYRILGRVLDLFNDKGESLARLEGARLPIVARFRAR